MAKQLAAIKIDAALLERLNAYREQTGIPVSRSANEAILDFLEVVVPARLEALVYQNDKKLTLPRKAIA